MKARRHGDMMSERDEPSSGVVSLACLSLAGRVKGHKHISFTNLAISIAFAYWI